MYHEKHFSRLYSTKNKNVFFFNWNQSSYLKEISDSNTIYDSYVWVIVNSSRKLWTLNEEAVKLEIISKL